MKTILFISCIALAPFSALAQSFPIQKMGTTCPLGYYTVSGYCVPSRSSSQSWSVPANGGTTCPLGTYKNGQYCSKSYGSSY